MVLQVIDCKTEYVRNPLGIDEARPRLFWRLAASERRARQGAYRVLVASSPERLAKDEGDLWDSGRVESDASVHVVYDGAPLRSEQRCYWKVRVWDRRGRESAWSEPAYWTMGLLTRAEWKAKLIGRKADAENVADVGAGAGLQPSPYFRKEVTTRGTVARATAYATALGVYELRVNGAPIGDKFAPGWTDYDKRLQVQTYDVTDSMRPGANAIGVILGDGWYSGTVGFLGRNVYGERPFFLLQLHIDYADGTRDVVVTDGGWKTARGPILYSDFIKGEAYDARLELTGWDAPGYDDAAWESPDIRPVYNGRLVSMLEPPVRATELLRPIGMRRTASGSVVFDMGQNMVGWTRLSVKGPRGAEVVVSHAEMLNPDGTLYLDNLRKAVQQERYILKGGEAEEVYEPRFTFHGFRYVELIGYPGEPTLDAIVGVVVHSDTPVAGRLETSDAMVNRLYSNIRWGQRGNFLSVPTDCPQRDERLGWTGDAQIFARTASYNMDVSTFFTKFMWDMIDCQQPSGAFTDVAPDAGWIRHKMWNARLNWFAPDNPGWGDAGVIIPWTLYLMYGDVRILETHYDAMTRWVDYLQANSDGLVRPGYANYGDWLSIDADTPNEVLATAYFAYSALLMSRIAGALGRSDDAARYEALHRDVAAAFRSAFVDAEGRIYGDTQTVYVLALQFGLLTEELRSRAIDRLAADIERRGSRLSTGFLGVGYLLPALTDAGRLDLAYALLQQETFPSWMYSIKHGATTIWERWDGWTEEKGFQTPSMNSFNHYSLGSVGEWMFRYMAGIEVDRASPGFRNVLIRPHPGGTLRWVRASYESLYGTIAVSWDVSEAGRLRLQVAIPANVMATVYVPASNVVVDGAWNAAEAAETSEHGWVYHGEEAGATVIRIGSGEYTFEGALQVVGASASVAK
ncbi:glycoside hydrolase family 78 protein [Paenibacillus antri]|uniref:glycoside hydrolase family 78 protein n=1 Tax=Paenibacillus antri TaxID=2582848 RepID=UPI001EE4A879|nr:glycoside hydrolase family 78 protein [Paenibacillus antri]